VTRRLLYVDVKWPTPKSDAASQRAVQLLRGLAALGFDVHAAAMFPPESTLGQVGSRALGGATAVPSADEGAVVDYVRRHARDFDAAVFAWTRVATRLIDVVRETNPSAFVVFDTVDVNHVREFRHARVSRNLNILRRAMAMKEQELRAVSAADCTVAVTSTDAELLRREAPGARVEVVTLAVPARRGPVPGPAGREGLLYLGNYQAWANVDAASYLVRDILPELRALGDERATVTLAGAGNDGLVDELASDSVRVLGYVEDLRDVFDRSRVFVCPLRIGSGIKGKLLTALSMGVPSVATPAAAEGMGLTDGAHYLAAESPREFASAVRRLQSDDTLWRRLSHAGRALVKSRFGPAVVRRQLRAVFGDGAVDAAVSERLR
jgi:O-antigen biosynthesis protein